MEHVFTDQNFASEVLKADMPVLVDFWAPWCGPCRMMGPVIEEVAKELEGKAKVGKMNVDENTDIPGKNGVMSIPTFIIFKQGKAVERFVGAVAKEEILEKMKAHI